jgi:hypothetical protein
VDTAVLTFPGHFFQTALCIQSLLRHYPDYTNTITIIADDVQCEPWVSYISDLRDFYQDRFEVIETSTLCKIPDCVAGWWRQQLIKLTLDQILPGHEWFVVDGDVIFRSRCEVADRVPISRRYDPASRWNQMCVNYVRGVLGTDQGVLHDQDQPVVTSPVPFRCLDRDLLQCLRGHVESRFSSHFVDLHLGWFQDQTIVADIDPPTQWVMSEWELIECFRQMVQGQRLPYHDLGSGFQIDADLEKIRDEHGIFLHSYKRDAVIGPSWFRDQGLAVPDPIWQRALAWYDAREARRLI